jgi:hypothetical protein
MSTEIIIIIGLSILCIILGLVLIFPKDKVVDGGTGGPGNWTEKQRNIIYDKVLLTELLNNNGGHLGDVCGVKILDVLRCIADDIANNYTFEYANLNFVLIAKDSKAKVGLNCLSICLGKKGNWSDYMKKAVYNIFTSVNLPEPENMRDQCITCLIEQLEQNYDPLDPTITDFIGGKNKNFDYSKELAACKLSKQCA